MQRGDAVILKSPFWYNGKNIGGYLGYITDVSSYILVRLYNEDIPIKCLQYEVKLVEENPYSGITEPDEDPEPII
jgi:hypothetical protein